MLSGFAWSIRTVFEEIKQASDMLSSIDQYLSSCPSRQVYWHYRATQVTTGSDSSAAQFFRRLLKLV